MFQTVSKSNPSEDGGYDEGPVICPNGYPVHAGAHLLAVGKWAWVISAVGTCRTNLAGVTCGCKSNLDPKTAITNRVLSATTQICRVTMAQTNSLNKGKVNMRRVKGDRVSPSPPHDYTCCTDASELHFHPAAEHQVPALRGAFQTDRQVHR
jgi:hypothetical protein